MKKWLSRTIDGILLALVLFLVYCQVSMIVTQNKNYGVPSIFGTSFLYVATDSMKGNKPDSLNKGTGIIINRKSPDSVVVGDVITFYYPRLQAPDTHRVLEIEEKDGKRVFKTRGDNLSAWSCPDSGCPETPWESVEEKYYIGTVVSHSDAFGSFLTLVSPQAAGAAGKSAWLTPVLIAVPIVAISVTTIVETVFKYKKEKKKEEAELLEAMQKEGVDLTNDKEVFLFQEKYYYKQEAREQLEKEKSLQKKRMQKELSKEKKNKEKEK